MKSKVMMTMMWGLMLLMFLARASFKDTATQRIEELAVFATRSLLYNVTQSSQYSWCAKCEEEVKPKPRPQVALHLQLLPLLAVLSSAMPRSSAPPTQRRNNKNLVSTAPLSSLNCHEGSDTHLDLLLLPFLRQILNLGFHPLTTTTRIHRQSFVYSHLRSRSMGKGGGLTFRL